MNQRARAALVAVLAVAAVAASVPSAGARADRPGRPPALTASEAIVAQGRSFFARSCAHCHGRDADGGEDAPSLQKIRISPAHMTLVIQSGIKGDMPSFAKKYSDADIQKIVAYLQTLK